MTAAHKYACILENRGLFKITMMCRLLHVSTSGFYAWWSREPSTRELKDRELLILVREVFEEFEHRYGAVRIWKEFQARGLKCGRDKIARLMREDGLVAKSTWTRKRKPRTTDSEHSEPIRPNLLMRDFKTQGRDQVWLSDITYLATKKGWMYLAVVMDLHSRKIVGWTVRDSLKTEGALDALKVAIGNREPEAGLIHHSDRGIQYASKEYQEVLEKHGMRSSMSRVGDCWDNAPMESFFGRMKQEIGVRLFESKQAAQQAVFEHIERFYNPRRRHSALGYLSPDDFELMNVA